MNQSLLKVSLVMGVKGSSWPRLILMSLSAFAQCDGLRNSNPLFIHIRPRLPWSTMPFTYLHKPCTIWIIRRISTLSHFRAMDPKPGNMATPWLITWNLWDTNISLIKSMWINATNPKLTISWRLRCKASLVRSSSISMAWGQILSWRLRNSKRTAWWKLEPGQKKEGLTLPETTRRATQRSSKVCRTKLL